MALFTPINQKRLTNVSVVRLRKGGNRYELACYPNKVRAWRERLETNLDEVLQIHCVFTNVSKGQFANKKDLYQAFRMENETEIIHTILEQGELQLTEKERAVENQHIFRDVAKIVSERCVNPETNRAYTVTMIEKMMKDCHISLKSNKSAKQNALEVIKQLRSSDGFKIAPAMMEVVISIEFSAFALVKYRLSQLYTDVLRQSPSDKGNIDLAVVVEPENYGTIESFLHSNIKGKYCIEIVGNTKHDLKRMTVNKVKIDDKNEQMSTSFDRAGMHTADDPIKNGVTESSTSHKPIDPTCPILDKPYKKLSKSERKQHPSLPDEEKHVDSGPRPSVLSQDQSAHPSDQKSLKRQRKKKGKKGKSRNDDWSDED